MIHVNRVAAYVCVRLWGALASGGGACVCGIDLLSTLPSAHTQVSVSSSLFCLEHVSYAAAVALATSSIAGVVEGCGILSMTRDRG